VLRKLYIFIFLIVCITAHGTAQEQEFFSLNNGLRVIVVRDFSAPVCCAALVCPIPQGAGERELADAALIKYLVWGGSASGETSVSGQQLKTIAIRFGGSADSILAADALILYYSLPSQYLKDILRYMTLQISGLKPNAASIQVAGTKILQNEAALRTSSVLRQLLRTMEPYLWPDLPYRFKNYGSEQALQAAGEQSVLLTLRRISDPASWTLIITGDLSSQDVRRLVADTFGAVPRSEEPPATQPAQENPPKLGKKLQRVENLTRNHAVVAYRLPALGESEAVALALLAEYLRRAPGTEEVKESLGSEGKPATIEIDLDQRKSAGVFYLYASWESEVSGDDVLAALQSLAEKHFAGPLDDESMNAARKAVLIRYWTNRQSAQTYALWRAGLAARGVLVDQFTEHLESLDQGRLAEITKLSFTFENRLSLITVEK
jgi:zinc protease